MAIDGQGKFLFVLDPTSDDISMFQIDPASGALSEVPGSPFAVPALDPTLFPPCHPLRGRLFQSRTERRSLLSD
jgi:hypothetical protein